MTITVDVPEDMREKLEEKKEREYYSSMSELVREALRKQILSDEEEKRIKKQEAILEHIKEGKVEKAKIEGEAERKIKEGLKELEEGNYS